MRSSTVVIAHDLKNRPLELEDCLSVPQFFDVAGKYVMLDLTEIVRPLIELIEYLSLNVRNINITTTPKLCHIPEMQEFYWFLPDDRDSVLRKRRWP